VILGGLWIVQGRLLPGASALALAALGGLVIFARRPWRHPNTPLRRLMVPIYVVFLLAVGVSLALLGGVDGLGLGPWSVFLLLPILLPLWTVGSRRWCDGPPG
jgi:hypothetical protein